MNMKTIRLHTFIFFLFVAAAGILSAQDAADTAAVADVPAAAPSHLILAISSENYPVTPGDVYKLRFTTRKQEVISYELLVENNYTINADIIDRLNTSGVSFPQLKAVIEKKISDAYPNSRPSLTLASIGYFQVPVRGEVLKTQTVVAWGLSRLSKVLEGNLDKYSSIRDIMVRSRDSTIRTYDLMAGRMSNDNTGDPLLKPGDTVYVSRVEKIVEFRGEVFKPGTYQLVSGEGLKEAELFFGGYTPVADTSRIKIDRSTSMEPVSIYLNLEEVEGNFELEFGDQITIPPRSRNQSIIYIESAMAVPAAAEGGAAGTSQGSRESVAINAGERLYDVLYPRRDSFHPLADLRNAYIRREAGGRTIRINIEQLLYNYSRDQDLVLEPLDRIIIPVKDRFITVEGSVVRPGRYNYTVEDIFYYIDMASGFTTDADLSRIKIDRSPETIYLDLTQPGAGFVMKYGDTITVPAAVRNRPIVYIEGGIITAASAAPAAEGAAAVTGAKEEIIAPVTENARLVKSINIGERLYDVLNSIRGQLHPYADLRNSYIRRESGGVAGEGTGGETIAVNLEALLYNYSEDLDIVVQPFDRIVIPLKERFVTVAGAVNRPGRYYYTVPNVTYYIGMAGGIDAERNTNNEYVVLDEEGKPKDTDAPIEPGDTIEVVTNSFLYYYNRAVPIISTLMALVTAAISFWGVLQGVGQ